MKYKKASGFGDIYVIFIFLVVCTMTAGIGLFVFNTFNDSWQGVSEEVGTVSADKTAQYNITMNTIIDGAIILWFVILVLGSWVTAFFLDNSPVFFVIFLLLGFLSFFALLPFANMQAELAETALSVGYQHLPMTMFVSNNMILFLIAYMVGTGASLYIKTRVVG